MDKLLALKFVTADPKIPLSLPSKNTVKSGISCPQPKTQLRHTLNFIYFLERPLRKKKTTEGEWWTTSWPAQKFLTLFLWFGFWCFFASFFFCFSFLSLFLSVAFVLVHSNVYVCLFVCLSVFFLLTYFLA